MKNRLLVTGIWALVLVFGMTVIGCNNPANGGNGDGDGDNLPKSIGINEVSGKTYFHVNKIFFSATADGAASGTYTGGTYWGNYSDENSVYSGPVVVDGKYTYSDNEIGTYSWNEGAKTVTLKPEKAAYLDAQNGWGALAGKDDFRKREFDRINKMGETELAEYNQWLLSAGYSSVTDYVDYQVNEVFSNKTYDYSFSADGTALFLEQWLPANKGKNELSDQTYYHLIWEWEWEEDKLVLNKDENDIYVFTASGYRHTRAVSWYNDEVEIETITGSYAYDSSRKWVWLRPEKKDGKDRVAYYAEQTAPSEHYFVDDNAYCAVETNSAFFDGTFFFFSNSLIEVPYNSADKTIGGW